MLAWPLDQNLQPLRLHLKARLTHPRCLRRSDKIAGQNLRVRFATDSENNCNKCASTSIYLYVLAVAGITTYMRCYFYYCRIPTYCSTPWGIVVLWCHAAHKYSNNDENTGMFEN